MQKRIAFVIGIIFTLTLFTACQKRPSPPASATCDLGGGKTIRTNYSSPRMKGRSIYGDLVPFGEVWRAGANEATTFVTSSDVVRWRQDGAGRKLHNLHHPGCRQMGSYHQQEDWGMGNPLQV